mmetsp:Transcript_24396/g.66572  ORF Transcript_24396/g.66572 Transcript_24396/m.66572 type:complete len:448 (-) Transcript_24396:32-1375(-)
MRIRHALKVLDALLLDLLRLREAELPQQRPRERGVDKDREHGHASDVEQHARSNLGVESILRDAPVHADRQHQAHSAAQAAPRHHHGLPPRDLLTAAVEQRPEHQDHEEPDQGDGDVEDEQPEEVASLDLLRLPARDHAVPEEEAREQEYDGVPQELDELPDGLHGLPGDEARPCVVGEHDASADNRDHAAGPDLALCQEEAEEAHADGHGDLDHRVVVVPGLRGAEDHHETQGRHRDAQEHGVDRHLEEVPAAASKGDVVAPPHVHHEVEANNRRAVVQQTLTRDQHRQARRNAQRVEQRNHGHGVGGGEDRAEDERGRPRPAVGEDVLAEGRRKERAYDHAGARQEQDLREEALAQLDVEPHGLREHQRGQEDVQDHVRVDLVPHLDGLVPSAPVRPMARWPVVVDDRKDEACHEEHARVGDRRHVALLNHLQKAAEAKASEEEE